MISELDNLRKPKSKVNQSRVKSSIFFYQKPFLLILIALLRKRMSKNRK